MALSGNDNKDTVVEIDLFGQLLCANLKAFARLHFNTAYHALAAAMHEAKAEDSPARLAQIAHLADEQLAWIDDHAPFYEHSTTSCDVRQTTSIYTLLGRQARTNARILDVQRKAEVGSPEESAMEFLK